MKPRKAKDLRELTDEELRILLEESKETLSKQNFQHAFEELRILLEESKETLSKQNFQHALKQLHDTSYLKILRRDIARIQTIIKERSKTV